MNKITWTQGVPAQNGHYYVLGEGINGVQRCQFKDGTWDVKKSQVPLVYGELTDSKYRSITMALQKFEHIDAKTAERLKLDMSALYVSLTGERKDDSNEDIIVHASVRTDGSMTYFWHDPEDAATDVDVLDYFDQMVDFLQNATVNTRSDHKAQSEKNVSRTFTSKEDNLTPTSVPNDVKLVKKNNKKETHTDVPNIGMEDACENDPIAMSEDMVDPDDLPF